MTKQEKIIMEGILVPPARGYKDNLITIGMNQIFLITLHIICVHSRQHEMVLIVVKKGWNGRTPVDSGPAY